MPEQIDIFGKFEDLWGTPVSPEPPPKPPEDPNLIDIGGFGRWPERGLIPTAEAIQTNAQTEQGADLIESLSGVMQEAIEGGKLKEEDFEERKAWYGEWPNPFNPTNYRKLVDYAKSEADAKEKEVTGSGRAVRVSGEHLPTDFLLDLTDFSDLFKPAVDAPAPMVDAPAPAEVDIFAKLEQMQASRIPTFDEWSAEEDRKEERSWREATSEFGGSATDLLFEIIPAGIEWITEEAVPVAWNAFSGEKEAKKAFGRMPSAGWGHAKEFGKDIAGAIMDEAGGYDKPTERKREYERFKRSYHAMEHHERLLASSPYAKTTELGAFVINPVNLAPVGLVFGPTGKAIRVIGRKAVKGVAVPVSWGAYVTSKVGKGVAWGAGIPRKGIAKVIEKIGATKAKGAELSRYAVAGGLLTPVAPYAAALGGLEAGGVAVGATAGAMQKALEVFYAPSGHMRFLQRLATDKGVAPRLQRMAALAHKAKGTQLGDIAFNVVADGISAGAAMSAFNAAAGHTRAEEMGASFGTGLALGGVLGPIVGAKGAGKTTKGLTKRGELTPRSKVDVSHHMESKLDNYSQKHFKKLSPAAQVVFATNEMAGTSRVTVRMENSENLLKMANLDIEAKNEALVAEGKKPIDLLDRAPSGWANRETRSIFLNADTPGLASKVGIELLLHELGHLELWEMVARDPGAIHQVLREYADPKGEKFFIKDRDGENVTEIRLNKEAVAVWKDYNLRQKGITIGNDAMKLAHEIFADQFSMAFHRDPNIFQTLNPTFKDTAANAVTVLMSNTMGRVLNRLGLVDSTTGNPLTNTISRRLRKNPTIIKFIKKYKKARMWEGLLKDSLIGEKGGILIEPRKGQTGGESFTENFGGVPITDRQSKQFVLSDKVTRNELKDSIEDGVIEKAEAIQAKDEAQVAVAEAIQAKEQAEASSASEAVKQAARDAERIAREKLTAAQDAVKKTDYVGLGQGEEGRTLSRRMKDLFTKGQPDSPVAKIIDFLQKAIDGRFSISFGYRSGKRLQRYNKFYLRDITLWGWQISPKSGKFRSLKVMGWNNAVIRHNVEVLIKEGFITKKSAEQFMREFEVASEKAMRDPEGRINPLGFKENLKENEIMAAILGMESISKGEAHTVFKNKRLADFFTEQNELRDTQRSLKKAMVSYDAEALAGAAPTGRKGTGFDYYNVKNNYMPAMPEGKPREQTVPLPFIEDLGGEDAAAGFRRVATDTMRKAEFERFQKGITEKEKWDAIGNQSQLQPFMPRFPKRGEGKQYMPAERTLGLKDNITEDVLPSITQAKLSPQQLQAALAKTAGAKSYADEIGLTDFVKDRKSITRDEVEAYVRENSPKLEVEVLSKTIVEDINFIRRPGNTKFSEYQESGGENYREVIVRLPPRGQIVYTRENVRPIEPTDPRATDPNRFWYFETPDNVLQIPKRGTSPLRQNKPITQRDALRRVIEDKQPEPPADKNFSDELHFGDNVLLWLRLNDRIDANGKRVLFIEELQSNWHQKGRKEGYRLSESEKNTLREEFDGLRKVYDEPGVLDRMTEITDMLQDKGKFSKGVPDAPFKKNWPALGLKYAVKEAIEGGYDRVAWLDGEGQAARYDLSKHFNEIYIKGDFLPNRKTGALDGEVTIDVLHTERHMPPPIRPEEGSGYGEYHELAKTTVEKLPDFIGKELADKAIKDAQKNLPDNQTYNFKKEYSGLDLKVGGEGMKAFYDREMRSLASKISKKIKGGKVERDFGILRAEKGAGKPPNVAHAFDVPKDPAAVDSLRLYMPADRAPTDARPPSLMMERGEGKQYMPAAYHGTPHTFKAEEGAPMGRFRSAQIGTGEGAQAYGHGLYFAGKKQVAEHYRKMIGINDENIGARIKVDGKEMPTKFAELAKVIKDPIKRDAIRTLQEHNGDFDSALDFYKLVPSAEAVSKKAINDLRGRVELIEKRGSLYKVELAPKENEYLLWDKPLSEQPKGVREIAESIFKEQQLDSLETKSSDPSGGVFYDELKHLIRQSKDWDAEYNLLPESFRNREGFEDSPPAKLTSQFLLEAGIPGIKYLEGASRAKGKGDYNYVIFDEGAVTITEKMFMPAEQAGKGGPERTGLDVRGGEKLHMPAVTDFYKNWDNKFKPLDKFIEEAEMVGTRWAPKGEGSFYPLGYKTKKDWGGTFDIAYKKKGKSYDRLKEIRQAKKNLRREFDKFKRHRVELEGHEQLVDWATFVDAGGIGFHEQKGMPKQLVEGILVKTEDGTIWSMIMWEDIKPGYTTMEGGLARTTARDKAGMAEQLNRGEMQPLMEESKGRRAVVVVPLKVNQALDAINRPVK